MSTSLDCIDRDVLRSKIAELTGKKVLEMNQIDWYLVFNVRLEDDEHVIVRFAKEDRLNSLPDRMKDYAAILAYLGSPEPNGLNIPVPKIKHVEPNASDLVVDTYRSWRRLSVSVREQRIACSIRALAHAYGKIFNAPIPRTSLPSLTKSISIITILPCPLLLTSVSNIRVMTHT
ncbi:hypothetical protein BT96DRAFT_988541 [Gymnopus androsaceus JB14]|uniref:Uncharacterized protein n=1 Tax=Gymnopus androsaceus JB14 TaxID=1447944 RepID=A0A6A4I8Y3_9AGAR|nr:hypothetical protein BT96DRAFT_988541 [Gymnopus androsaceus JB14]